MYAIVLLLLAGPSRDAGLLGDEDWSVRTDAHDRLESAGPRSWLPAWQAERSGDPEAVRRARTLLEGPRWGRQWWSRRIVVLWLVYGPLDPATESDLHAHPWEMSPLHDDVIAYASGRGLLTPEEVDTFYSSPCRLFWRGDHFDRTLRQVRHRAAR